MKHKKSFRTILLVCASVIMLPACLVHNGTNIARNYTPLNTEAVQAPTDKAVRVYFDFEPIEFTYTKLGMIEVTGAQFSTNDELLKHLRYQAHACGANAVIGVKDIYTMRTEGIGYKQENQTSYSAHVYTGMAVKIDSSYRPLPRIISADTSYYRQIGNSDLLQAKRAGTELAASAVLGLVTVIAVIAIASQ